ncbi:nucleotidyl transferase AbiEii/AbiGii toxin family protein [Candidatus Poriferisocius sp.]|uniref:nucleotidyl transferase AbiEii/AbiGii toxin family protein n=1 Tax=Candidatus Poriferisocius sp. TaxID=3101276 RepID=UPI003B0296B0
MDKVRSEISIEEVNLARDYWLTSCLYSLFRTAGRDAIIYSGQGKTRKESAVVAFAGGTSLVSAWDITRRYSEDLDLMALMFYPQASQSSRTKALSIVTKYVATGVTNPEDSTVIHMGDVGHRITYFGLGNNPKFLKMETSVEDCAPTLYDTSEIISIMGRFASAEQLKSYPELGGFELPTITPEYTAANKFDALHRRAETNNLRGIIGRGRDLYDLAMIALSDRAYKVREAIPELAEQASRTTGNRITVPRPRQGYSASILFRTGSESQEALRHGYAAATRLVWEAPPPFEEALELAASLDFPY